MKLEAKKAMTLTEILMAVAILTVVMAGLYASLALGNRTWRFFEETIAFKQEIRRALFTMSRDLREADKVFFEKTEDVVRLKYFKPKVGEIQFIWYITGEKAHRLVKKVNVNERVLAKEVSKLDFIPNENSVIIDIAADKKPKSGTPIHIELKQKVALREKTGVFASKGTHRENQK